MKKIFFLSLFLTVGSFHTFAQVRSNNGIASTIANQSAFLDASASGFTSSTSNGKGLAFPRTNLTTFAFQTQGNFSSFPTGYDGMVIYNTGTGVPISGKAGQPSAEPGFYYFSNPTSTGATASGEWRPMGSPKVNVTNAEAVTNTTINGAAIYTIKGTFTTNGTSTAPTAYAPANPTIIGMTGLYRITIFKAGTGTVYANSVYSYDLATGNIITGSPLMSVVYPEATYDYVLEYTK